jgi:transposase
MVIESHLPDSDNLHCQQITVHPDKIVIVVQVISYGAICPVCGQVSLRIHSHYQRKVSDLPWHGTPVELRLETRKYFCDTLTCPQHIFAERLDRIAPVYARKTLRLIDALRSIGFSLGGEAGSRLTIQLGMPASSGTLLRQIKKQVPSLEHSPHPVVGIDDWAFRRGFRYGTIVCDLENHRPIDLLPDRNPHHVANWLKAHPELQIISRDRGSDYIHAANEGAPQAIQVADRWHLIHNLRETLEKILDGYHREIRKVSVLLAASGLPSENTPVVENNQNQASRNPASESIRHRRRRERYEEVIKLHQQGKSARAIAHQLGLYRGTVARYIQADSFPERASRSYPHRTDSIIEAIRQIWDKGCHNAAQIFREMQSEEFTGSYYAIRRRVARWRTESVGRSPPAPPIPVSSPSSKRIAEWLVMEPQKRTIEEQTFLETFQTQCPMIATIAPLIQTFADMVRHRKVQELDPWLAQVQDKNVPNGLKGFARGLQGDPAVRAALTLEWSNGQVEGQINRLKLIKRQMYGRAGFDLLRQRVLYRG